MSICLNCSEEIVQEEAKFCPNCGNKIERESARVDIPEKDEEYIIMEGLCNRVKNKLYVENGKAILTNKRFIYMKHSVAKLLVIGVISLLTDADYDFAIPIDNILNIEDGRQGISKTVIINTKDGEKYNFYVTKREVWKKNLENLIN